MEENRKPILKLLKIKKNFRIKKNVDLKAVQDVSFTIYEGEKFGVVGESGCGKSTLGRVILQLYKETSGSCVYYGKSIQEVYPDYIKNEISKLRDYQDKAKSFYEKSLKLDRQIEKDNYEVENYSENGSVAEIKKYDSLKSKIAKEVFDSKELKKNASRSLREGSRTVGSLILCENIDEIAQIFQSAENEIKKAYYLIQEKNKLINSFDKNNIIINHSYNFNEKIKKYENNTILSTEEANLLESLRKEQTKYSKVDIEKCKQENIVLQDKISNLEKEIKIHYDLEMGYRNKALSFRGKNVLPITERCLDQDYQKKLDGNYETGINLGRLKKDEIRKIRRDIQMIFQDPAASLDPRQTVGKAIEEVFTINTDFSREVKKAKTMEFLRIVGLKEEHYYSYPSALSGGQKQRVGIARAIALNPSFVVLDEAVSALDVSVQAQILQLLNKLSVEHNLTYFFITHDLGVVRHFCDRVLVMYLGNVCELAPAEELFNNTLHPYTKSLLASVPRLKIKDHQNDDENILEGEVPSPINAPSGCPFHTRCNQCMPICKHIKPKTIEKTPGHFVTCHLYYKEENNNV